MVKCLHACHIVHQQRTHRPPVVPAVAAAAAAARNKVAGRMGIDGQREVRGAAGAGSATAAALTRW